MSDARACLVMTTVPNKEQAEKIARAVLEARLAACVQIQGVTSFYWWDGKINRDAEQLLYLKTTAKHYAALEAAIIANHTYDTPEILQMPIERGFEKYLDWMQRETSWLAQDGLSAAKPTYSQLVGFASLYPPYALFCE